MELNIAYEFIMKIIISVLLGGLIGLEREITGHPAGFRTNMLICLGSTLFILVPFLVISEIDSSVNAVTEIPRVAAGIITGIGFLGAGVIFRKGVNVRGLTTAATIWVGASIGLLVGIGSYIIAIFATILIVMVLHFFHSIEEEYLVHDELEFLKIVIKDKTGYKTDLEAMFKSKGLRFSLLSFKRTDGILTLFYKVRIPRHLKKDNLTKILHSKTEVLEMSWQE